MLRSPHSTSASCCGPHRRCACLPSRPPTCIGYTHPLPQLKRVGKGHGVFHFDERIDEGGLTAAA